MKDGVRFLFCAAVLLLAGCETTEVKPVTWKEQSAYMAQVKDPRQLGYSIYQTPRGVDYRGGFRLHPNQTKQFSMEVENPLRPVLMLPGKFGTDSALLLDFSSISSWLEFDLAQQLGAQPISEGKAVLVKTPGDEVPGCLSVVSTIRAGQIFMENPMVYVRMANGFLGPLARGIEKPAIKGVLGWDILKAFEQIYFDYPGKRIVLSTTAVAYDPNPALLVAKVPLVKYAGACAVRGAVDGKESLILIDPAGDFEVATDRAAAVSTIQLDADLTFSGAAVTNSPGGVRIGARLLQKYRVMVCPSAGAVYFEKPGDEKDQ